MHSDPKNPTGPATRSTVYDQPGPAAPDPAATPASPAPANPAPAAPVPAAPPAAAPEEADGEEALADPATTVQPDTSGETDPGASATNDAHPL